MHISFANKGKTQVGWAIIIGWKMWRWANANNILPKGSPYHVPNPNEMAMRSLCLEASKNIVEMGMCKTNEQMEKVNPKCQ